MKVYVVDTVADTIIVEDHESIDAVIDPDRPGVQTFTVLPTTVRFEDQDGTGHFLGVVAGSNEDHTKLVAKAVLSMLTAHGRM